MTLHEEILEEFDEMTEGNKTFEWNNGILRKQIKRYFLSALKRYGEAMVGEIPENMINGYKAPGPTVGTNFKDYLRSKYIKPLEIK